MALIFSIASRNKRSAFFQLMWQINTKLEFRLNSSPTLRLRFLTALLMSAASPLILWDFTIAGLLLITKALVWCGRLLLRDSLSVLKGDHCHFVDDKRVLWSDTKSLAEETFRQLRVVCQAVLQANVQHRQMTPGENSGKDVLWPKYTHTKSLCQYRLDIDL